MAAGQPYEQFWELTYREIDRILRGVEMRRVNEYNDQVSLAWRIEAFARTKRLPKLKDVMIDPTKGRRAMSPQHLQSAVKAWLDSAKKAKRKPKRRTAKSNDGTVRNRRPPNRPRDKLGAVPDGA